MFLDEEKVDATYENKYCKVTDTAYFCNFQTLGLEDFMLYAHGSDLCHDLELRHAMANCFEALMGALFLDGGIEVFFFFLYIEHYTEKKYCSVYNNSYT